MPPTGSDWVRVFADDFDGSAIDTTKWVVESTPNAGGSTVGGGVLQMRIDNNNWTFLRLYTANKFRFQFGYAEARIKIPSGKGYWPAFWTFNYDTPTPSSTSEIDIMECQGATPSTWRGHYHYHKPTDYAYSANPTYSPGVDLSADYHLYAAQWSPTGVTFYLDGVQVAQDTTHLGQAPANIWLQNRLDLAGVYGGPPDGGTTYPGDMLVDYVYVWQRVGWRGYQRVQCSDVSVVDATFKAELQRLGCSANVVPNLKTHPRTVGVRDYVIEYAAEQAMSAADIANALFVRCGIAEATLLAALTVTTYAGADWDARRVACKAALGI